jgi:hypothetical protein
MMARPVAEYLVRFDGARQAGGGPQSKALGASEGENDSGEELKAALKEAHEEGYGAGYAAACHECETRIAEQMQANEERLVSERERWVKQESEKLGAKIEAAFLAIETNIAESAARVLQPLALHSLRLKTIDSLSAAVSALLDGKEGPVIEILGPEDVLAALQKRLPNAGGCIQYTLASTVDVQVRAGQTVIETQIAAWAARIGPLGD